MAFFKSKAEKEIIAKMEREEQMEVFQEQINELKQKRQEYAKICAEAELNGDEASYNVALNALIEMNDVISSLLQTKTNYDIIVLSNSIAVNMAVAMNILDKMANGKTKMPNLKKIQRTQLKMNKYMRNIKISQRAMGSALKHSNPANRARSQEEINSVKSLINVEKNRLGETNFNATKIDSKALLEEIEKEKNKL